MNDKEEFSIILWSTEDIKIKDIELDRVIRSQLPAIDAKIVAKLTDIKEMELVDFKEFLENISEKSALIISPKEELKDVDIWKLGFIMGKMCSQGKNKIILLKGNINSFFNDMDGVCFKICYENEILTCVRRLMKAIGIELEINAMDFKIGKKIAKERKI